MTGTTPTPAVTSPANGATTSSRVISGTGTSGDTVTLTIDGAAVATGGPITVGADGRWSYGAAGLADGQHTVTATQTRAGDGPSASSAADTFVLNTGAPTGLAQKGTASNGGPIEITGTGDAAGDTVRLYDGTTLVGSGTAGANGAFDIVTSASFADGTYAITATDTSTDGTQTSGPSAAVNALVSPIPPTVNQTAESRNATPTLTGTGEVGAAINLTVDGTLIANAATVGADGTWSYTTGALAAGTHTAQATETRNGVTSGPSNLDSFVVDRTPVSGGGTTPPPGGGAVSLSSRVAYSHGVFTLSGRAVTSADVGSVEISAVVNGVRQDLGAAALAADGSFTFQDKVGAGQSAFEATLNDGSGVTVSADPGFTLRGGLGPRGRLGLQNSSDASGAPTSNTLFGASGRRQVSVDAPGQTVDLQPCDLVLGYKQPRTTFVYTPGSETGVVEVIHGFRYRGADHDTLSLAGADFGNSIADVLRHTGEVNGSAFVTDPVTGDAIRLTGVSKADLKAHPNDFTFHA